ncbi:MAG: sn-glycerol-3-phosphate ABC transporter ATP-binding protein UgpC [Myxococcales bacterium]|nr:sn-glycerol-3-phosphate ABC transporter ATP-binding protein UgpC [Myxococcales bacterium]
MAELGLRDIRKAFGETHVLKGVDLSVRDGELVVLVGPSGCGKSTLLRTIAGLELPDSGTLHIGGRDVTKAAPKDRDIGMVFQSYALYPHLTVRDNLAFGLRLRKTDDATVKERVDGVAKMLGLAPLLDRYPRQLSGGQRQRVAMGRAIARRPALFLFDEPLSNLDAALRAEVRVEIKRLHAELSATMVYVTHDQVEAMTLADKLVVLNGGLVEQEGPPLEIYERPATKFVAGFLGSPAMNFLEGTVADGRVRGEGFDLAVAGVQPGKVTVGIRPHDVHLDASGGMKLVVEVVEAMGFETYAHGKLGGVPFVARLEGDHRPGVGETISLSVTAGHLHLFDESDRRISVAPPASPKGPLAEDASLEVS